MTSLMYTRARVPTRVGVITHHPLRSTIPGVDALVCADSGPIFWRTS